MKEKLKRFIETTLPNVIGFGLVEVVITHFVGWEYGLVGVVLFTIINLLLGD